MGRPACERVGSRLGKEAASQGCKLGWKSYEGDISPTLQEPWTTGCAESQLLTPAPALAVSVKGLWAGSLKEAGGRKRNPWQPGDLLVREKQGREKRRVSGSNLYAAFLPGWWEARVPLSDRDHRGEQRLGRKNDASVAYADVEVSGDTGAKADTGSWIQICDLGEASGPRAAQPEPQQ